MKEENRKDNITQIGEQEEKEKAAIGDILTPEKISKGTLELAIPIRARSEDVKELHYDFSKLTGWEYAEAMDTDKEARNMFVVSKKQALCLFAAAAAKATDGIDAKDVKERIGLADAQRAVQVATLFLNVSAQAAGKNTFGE